MTLSPTQLLIFALLITCLVTATLTWLQPIQTDTSAPLTEEIFEWFAVNATSITIGDNGQPKHQVTAARLTHYNPVKQTIFLRPVALVFHPELPAWQLTADKGVAFHNNALEENHEIDLRGHVLIWRAAAKDLPRSEMQTDFLKFFPQKEYVETDRSVHFAYGQHKLSGTGMWANLQTQQIQLLDNVQGQYINE